MRPSPFTRLLLWTTIVSASCVSDDLNPPVDCTIDGPEVQVTSLGEADCNQQNGFVEVSAVGGDGNYAYSIDCGTFQSSQRLEGLGAGTHTVMAKDDNGCEASVSLSVNNKEGVNLTLESTEAGCGGSEGTITASPDGGEGPYEYSIDGGAFQSTAVFANLSNGEYVVSIRDQTACETSQTIRVNSGISFAASIQPIITNSCAINDCHNGNQFPDFRVFKNIKDNAANIKKLTGDGTMPDEGTLTRQQIDQIACWVDDGALQN